MATLNPYLIFNGDGREAMEFYHRCLGGNLKVDTFGSGNLDVPANLKDRVLHAELKADGILLMCSDSMPDNPSKFGDNVSLSLSFTDAKEQEKIFNDLAHGGKVVMPLQDTFWNATYGQVIDRFGILWQLNCEKK